MENITSSAKLSEPKCENEKFENTEAAFATLRALENALNRRINVKTSRVELSKKDANAAKLVDIEGVNEESVLEILEESISDLISLQNNENQVDIARRSFEGQAVSSSSASNAAILNNSSSVASAETASSFYSIPSCKSSFDGIISPESLKNAEDAIADLQVNGPAGLVHLSSLSAAIGKPIRIWSSNGENSRKVGRTRTGEAVDVEYHEAGPGETQGHWTLRGNVEPRDVKGELNDCLFCVVADQTGRLAPELRKETISRMRKNIASLANRIDAIAEQEKCDRISLLIGGARYNGQRPQDAAEVIDNSQQGRCHPSGMQGHPRGHASHPEATGPTESVENYSRGGWKSGFFSREDQDAVAHLVLETKEAQRGMRRLNEGEQSIALHLSPGQLAPGPLPEGGKYVDGRLQGGAKRIKELVMVLRHHYERQNDPDADVFVHTFYPVVQ